MSEAASMAVTGREFEDRLTSRRRQRITTVGREGVLWLAVVPAWTEEVAVAVGYPTDDKPLADFVGQAEKAGLCVRSQSSSPDLVALLRVRALVIGSAEESASRALATVRQIHDERRRVQALIELIGWLPDHLSDPVVTDARLLSPASRARVLAALANRRFPSAAPGLPAEAVAAAKQSAPAVRLQVLTQLIPVLPARLLDETVTEVLTSLEAANDPLQEADLLGRLAPALRSAGLSRALRIASSISDPAARSSSLTLLAARLPKDQQLAVLVQAEAAATSLYQREMRDLVQSSVAQGFARAGYSLRARAMARQIGDYPIRATLLGELAVAATRQDHAEEVADLVGEAVSVLAAVPAERSAVVLAEIAANLAQAGVRPAAAALMENALRVARDLHASADSLSTLMNMARALTAFGSADAAAEMSTRAYRVAQALGDGAQRCDALLAVLPLLPLPLRPDAIQDARRSTRSIPDPRERLRLLISLGKLIAGPERQSVASEALTVADRAATEFTFWMPDGVRSGVLKALRDDLGSAELLATVARIGSRVANARQDAGISLSDALAKWADLAVRASDGPTEATSWLGKMIDKALARRDVPEATAWVAAGQTMAGLLGEELDVMARFGGRRLELLQRQAHDEHLVSQFMKRDLQVAAFTDLLDADDTEPWALHYIGMGGVGKTMLLRYLTARVAPERRAVTCRVDFDHLSPDYPVRRPGQLLLELMNELQTYASTGQEHIVGDFQDRIVHLHEVTSDTEGTAEFRSAVDTPQFQSVLRSFCGFVNSLDRKVVLILDTCEELAKIPPVAGMSAVAVAETLKLLRTIKKSAPAVRVVFAGRRLLVQSGYGWRLADDAPPHSALVPEHDKDLRLHEIRGFDEQEAHTFLTVTKGLTSLAPDIEQAIRGQSPDSGTAADIIWTDPGQAFANGPADQPRFNPFDLSMLADWARETGASTPDAIRSADTDLYIERRIMGRLASTRTRLLEPTQTADAVGPPSASRQAIERVMPAVVLLRRFDRTMLRPACPDDDATFEAVYQALIGQEWIDIQTDERLGTTLLEVDRNLYPRLRAYFKENRRGTQLDQAAALLGPRLRDRILDLNPWEVPYEAINAALELLPPADASALWDEIGVRVARDGRWDWAESVPGRLLAEGGAVAALDSPLRAAVLATRLAGLQHRWPDADLTGGWQEVRGTLDLAVDPCVRGWLRCRAAVAAYITAGAEGDWVSLLRIWAEAEAGTDALARYRREQLAAALISGLETSLERLEAQPAPVLPPPSLEICLAWIAEVEAAEISPQLQAFAHVLAGRAQALTGDQVGAESQLRQAGRLVAEDRGQRQAWFDWRAPDSVPDRVQLERLRFWSPLLAGALEDDQTALPDSPSLDNCDAERLVSARLGLRLRHAPVAEDELERLTVLDGQAYRSDRQPACNAHRLTPPLFATLALGWLAAGRPDRARALVADRQLAAIRSASDAWSIAAADRINLELTRRLRQWQGTRGVPNADYRDRTVLGLALAAGALVGGPEHPVPEQQDPPLHLYWRTRTILRPERDQEFLRQVRDQLPSGPVAAEESFDSASLFLDRIELELLTREPGAALSGVIDPGAWLRTHQFRTEEAMRLALRADALGVSRPDHDRWARPAMWADTVGARWMASLAMAEGELLALRLPGHARRLLEFARQLYEQADDRAGALFATVCGAIAEIHADPEEQARRRIPEEIQRSYEALDPVVQGFDPPSWDALQDRAQAGAISQPASDTSAWSGWTARIVACLIWARDPTSQALAEPMVADSGAPAELLLSADLTAKNANRFSWPWLTVIAGFLTAGFVAGAQVLTSVFWHGAPWWAVLAASTVLLIGAPILVAAFPILASGARSMRRSHSLVRVSVLAAEAGPASSPWPTGQAFIRLDHWPAHIGRLSVSGILRLYSRCIELLFLKPGQWRAYEAADTEFWTGPIPPVRDYRHAAVADPIGRELDSLATVLRGHRRLPVAFIVAPEVAGVPWEALLTGAARTEPDLVRTQFYRWGPPLATATLPAEDHASLAVLADERWWPLAERGWGTLADRRRLTDASRALPAAMRISVLHVIGRALSSTSGSLLQVSSAGERMKSAAVESAVRRTGELLSPDQLPLDRVDLLVLEAEPAEFSPRLDSDREKTAELRRFAADCFQAGAGAVLMIPALPPALAEQVLSILAARPPERQCDPYRLFPTLTDIQAQIRDGFGPDYQATESALDLCLFARHPWPQEAGKWPPEAGKSGRNEAS